MSFQTRLSLSSSQMENITGQKGFWVAIKCFKNKKGELSVGCWKYKRTSNTHSAIEQQPVVYLNTTTGGGGTLE